MTVNPIPGTHIHTSVLFLSKKKEREKNLFKNHKTHSTLVFFSVLIFWYSSHSPNLPPFQIALFTQFSFTHFRLCHWPSLHLISMCLTLFLGLPLLLKPVKSLVMGKGKEKCKNKMRRWGIIPRNGTNPLFSPNLEPHSSFSFGRFWSFLLSLRYIFQIFFS